MGSFNIDMETNAMHQFLISTRAEDRLYLSTAYFNPSHEYIELITKKSNSEYHVLASAPEVRSSYFLPAECLTMYCQISLKFAWSVV